MQGERAQFTKVGSKATVRKVSTVNRNGLKKLSYGKSR